MRKMYQIILMQKIENLQKNWFSSLKTVLSAGSPLRLDIKENVLSRISENLFELYGFSEGFATMLKPYDQKKKFGSVGTPMLVGVQGGLDKITISEELALKNVQWESFFDLIVSEVTIIHAICGTFMPIMLIVIMTRFFGSFFLGSVLMAIYICLLYTSDAADE